MSLSNTVPHAAMLLLLLWVALITPSSSLSSSSSSSSSSSCPLACLCDQGPHVNCSSLGLQWVPSRTPVTVRSLNLSHNALRSLPPLWPGSGVLGHLGQLWLDRNNMESLSLCLRRAKVGMKSSAREGCVSWAPALRMLSAEGNQMHQVPKGLGGSTHLQVLQLSHNRISALGPSDFRGCGNLTELHLHSNRIRTIHPLAFRDLQQLQVLDLRLNWLTTIPSPVYLSLLNLEVQVHLHSNRWRCDCNLQAMRHKILQKYPNQIPQSWSLVCSSPVRHAGKDLQHLSDRDLTCPSLGYSSVDHFDEVAEMGSDVLLPCGPKDEDCSQALWWTPHGQVTGMQHGLLIADITESDAGLYVCVTGQQQEQVSVFDLNVLRESAHSRLKRAVEHRDLVLEGGNNRNAVRAKTQGQFDLAVSLSVIITFIIAFIIGVLVRPCFDKLWKKIRSKKNGSHDVETEHDNSYQQPPVYDNEAFQMVDEPAQARAGQRVRISDVTEVIYDDAASESSVDSEDLRHNGSVVVESAETQQQSSSAAREPMESDLPDQQGSEASERDTEALYEPIPDPEDLAKDTNSLSSAYSTGDQDQVSADNTYENIPVTNRQMEEGESATDDTPEQTADQQSAVVRPVAVPVFDAEPFQDWSKKVPTKDLDPELWNDSGESFSFTDGSERSSIREKPHSQPAGVTNEPLPADSDSDVAPPQPKSPTVQEDADEVHDDMGYDEMSRRSSSTASVDSGDEPTEYTVNPEEDDEEEEEKRDEEEEETLAKVLAPNVIPLQSHSTVTSPSEDDALGNRPRLDTIIREQSDMTITMINDSSDQGPFNEDSVFPEDDQARSVVSQLPSYPARQDRFYSSEDEEEPKKYNVHPVYRRRPVLISESSYSERMSLTSADEEELAKFRPHTNALQDVLMPELESRPIIINKSSPRPTSDPSIKDPNRVIDIDFENSATSTDDLGTTFQIEDAVASLSLDQVPRPKRALVIEIKDTLDHERETGQRQPNSGFLSSSVAKQNQLPSQPRPSASSQDSASSDDNDEYATSTDHLPPSPLQIEGMMAGVSLDGIPLAKRALDIRVKDSVTDLSDSKVTSPPRLSVSFQDSASSDDNDNYDSTIKTSTAVSPPSHPPPPPPSPGKIEGMLEGVSLDQIPLAKKALDIRIKDSVTHHSESKVTSPPRLSVSFQDSASSDDDYDSTIKTSTVVRPPSHPPPPPPDKIEGMLAGVSLDQIPLAKKALDIRVKDNVVEQQAPALDQKQSNLNSLSGSISITPSPREPPPSPDKIEGMLAGVSLDQIPLAKKALDIRIKDSVTHHSESKVTSPPRLSVSFQDSASSDDDYDSTIKTSTVVRPPSHPPPPPPDKIEGMLAGVSLDQIPLAKKALDIRVKDNVVEQQAPALDQKQSNLNSLSGSISITPSPREPPPSPDKIEGMLAGVSLDQIPLAKKALDIRVKDSVTDHSESKVTSPPRLSVSFQDSASSDDDYDSTVKTSTPKPPSHPPPPPPDKIEGMLAGVSLDQIPLAKRALDIRVKNSEDHQQVLGTNKKQSSLGSLPGAVDLSPKYPAPLPPSQNQIEGMMAGVSVDRIPLARKALDIRVKDSVKHHSESKVTSPPRLSVSFQDSASSDDDYDSTIKTSTIVRPPSHPPPPPPDKIEGMLAGVSLDQIPLAKRALDIRVKDSEDHQQVLGTNKKQSSLGSLPGAVDLSPKYPAPLPPSQNQIEGMMAGVSVDRIPLAKKALDIRVKDSHSESRVTSPPRLSVSFQDSASSDDDYDSTIKTSTVVRPPRNPPPPPPSPGKIEGMLAGVSLDQIPLAKKALDIRVKDNVVEQQAAALDQKQSNLNSLSGSISITPSLREPPPSPDKIEGMMAGVSLDQIPLAKRALDIRVKDSVDEQQVSPSDQKQSNLSSLSGVVNLSPKHPAPPPPSGDKIEEMMAGVSLDRIPLAKRALDIRVKDQVVDTNQRQSNSSSLSGVMNLPPKRPAPQPPSQHHVQGIIAGVSLDQIPLARRALDIRVKDGVSDLSNSQLSRQPGLGVTSPHLPSSDEDDDYATVRDHLDSTGKLERLPGHPSHPAPRPLSQDQTGGIMAGVSLDRIPLARRALDIRVKDSVDHQQALGSDLKQSDLGSLSGAVDLSPKNPGPLPPSQDQIEGMMTGVSLGRIPLAKRALDIRVKDSVTDLSDSQLSRQPGLGVSSSHFESSDEDDYATIRDNIGSSGKIGSLSGAPSHPPPSPPSQYETQGIMAGVSLDRIPLAKRALDIRIKESVYQEQVLDPNQRQSNLGSLSVAPSHPPPSPPSPYQTEGIMAGISLDRIPLAKRALDIRIKDSVDHQQVPTSDHKQSISTPVLSGTTGIPPSRPEPPPSQDQIGGMMGGVSLDRIPLARRALDIRVKDSMDHKQVPEVELRKTQVSSLAERDYLPPSHPAPPPPSQYQTEGIIGRVSLDRIPLAKRALDIRVKDSDNITSPTDYPMSLRDTTTVRREHEMPTLTASYRVHRPPVSGDSSPTVDDYKGHWSSLDHLPKPKTSLIFRSSNDSASLQKRWENNVEAEPNLRVSSKASLSANGSTENLDKLPMPKRYLQFTTTRDAAVQDRRQLLENHQGLRSSSESMKYQPHPELTPEVDQKLSGMKSYSSKFTTRTEDIDSSDQLSLDHLPAVKRSLAFSYSADTTAKTDLPVDTVIARNQSVSSFSSVGSDHSKLGDYTQGGNNTLDSLPLPRRSLKFSTTTPDAVGPPTQTYLPSVTRQTDLHSRSEELTSVYRPRAMDGFTTSFQRSSISSGGSPGGRSSLSSFGSAIPFHSDHTFRSVSAGSAVFTSTTRKSSDTSEAGDTLDI